MTQPRISSDVIAEHNAVGAESHARQLEALETLLTGRGLRLSRILPAAGRFELVLALRRGMALATPTGQLPALGAPRSVETMLADAAVVQDLTGLTPSVSLALPDGQPQDALKPGSVVRRWGVRVGCVHSAAEPYGADRDWSGAFSHPDAAVRREAIERNLGSIRLGRGLGAKGFIVGLAEPFGHSGHTHARRSLDHVIDSLENIYSGLPRDWRLLLPSGSSRGAPAGTVLLDWGTVWMVAQELGPQAFGVLDLGGWPPNGTLEQVLARLISVNRLGGFQLSGRADATVLPQQLLLALHELADAAQDAQVLAFRPPFGPIGLIDDLAPGKDPVETAIQRALALHRASTQALLVDHERLAASQDARDLTMAEETLRTAFETDVSPILAEVRRRHGAALDPLGVYRSSGHRAAALPGSGAS